MPTKRELLGELSYEFIRRFVLKTKVVRPRSYGDKKEYVQGLARQLTKDECAFVDRYASEGRSAEVTADTFTRRHRPDDSLVRSELKPWIDRRHDAAAVLEEVTVGDNRADIVTVDDTTTAYEIKSPRDSLHRLGSQLPAYSAAFDYVLLVLPSGTNVPETVTSNVGIVRYCYPEFTFETVRQPTRTDTDVAAQLDQLWLQELRPATPTPIDGDLPAEEAKEAAIQHIKMEFSQSEVDVLVRSALRQRVSSGAESLRPQATLSV